MPRTAARVRRNVADEIDGDDLIPVLIAQLNEKVVSRHAGIGDQHVELAHGLFRALYQRIGFGRVGEVTSQHVHALAEFGGQLVEILPAGSGNGDGGALGVKNARDGAADAAGGAGDQRGFSFEVEHLACPLRAHSLSPVPP